jgi:hypothetical protein
MEKKQSLVQMLDRASIKLPGKLKFPALGGKESRGVKLHSSFRVVVFSNRLDPISGEQKTRAVTAKGET